MTRLRRPTIGRRATVRGAILGMVTMAFNLAAPLPAQAAPPSADLEIRMIESPSSAVVGQEFTYKMTVDNRGPDAAPKASFDDTLPPELTLVSVAASAGTCSGSTTAHCDLGMLNKGATVSVTMTVRAEREGTATNTASVASQRSDPNTSNNSATATTTIVSGQDDPPADGSTCKGSFQGNPSGGECRLQGAGGMASVFGWAADPFPYGGCMGYPLCWFPYLSSVQLTVTVTTLDGQLVTSCSYTLSTGNASCANTSSTVVAAGTELLCRATASNYPYNHTLFGEFGCVAAP